MSKKKFKKLKITYRTVVYEIVLHIFFMLRCPLRIFDTFVWFITLGIWYPDIENELVCFAHDKIIFPLKDWVTESGVRS